MMTRQGRQSRTAANHRDATSSGPKLGKALEDTQDRNSYPILHFVGS